jgi:adenylate cyclase
MAVLASRQLHAMSSTGPVRRLSAILNADVAGYSRLMGDDEAGTMALLKTHRLLVADLVGREGGRVVDATGDNILAEFPSVVGAVHAATAIQNELARRNADIPPPRRMELRIGVNLGDVLVDGDRIYGEGVNVAARLQALAEPGGTCISGTVFDQVENKLQLPYEPLGEHTVKNIARPLRVYRIRAGVTGEPRGTTLHLAPADQPAIAVLPFANLGGDPDQDYFAEGIAEDVITDLSKVSQLSVIERHSAFRYKDRRLPVQDIARELGVRFLLEGSVRRAGTRVRISVQLVDTRSGRPLWAERYDRDLADIFAVQDDITRRIVEELEVTLTSGEQARLLRRTTRNVEAYDALLRGLRRLYEFTPEGSADARAWFERAAVLDPACSTAHAFVGGTHLNDLTMGFARSRADSFTKLQAAATRALELDSESAITHMLLSWVHLLRRDHDAAIADAERAVALAPGAAATLTTLAVMLNMAGRPEEGLAASDRALRLSPIPRSSDLRARAVALRLLGRYAEAIALYEACRRAEPHSTLALIGLTIAHVFADDMEGARATAREILTRDPTFSVDGFAGLLYRDPAQIEREKQALRRAGLR